MVASRLVYKEICKSVSIFEFENNFNSQIPITVPVTVMFISHIATFPSKSNATYFTAVSWKV